MATTMETLFILTHDADGTELYEARQMRISREAALSLAQAGFTIREEMAVQPRHEAGT